MATAVTPKPPPLLLTSPRPPRLAPPLPASFLGVRASPFMVSAPRRRKPMSNLVKPNASAFRSGGSEGEDRVGIFGQEAAALGGGPPLLAHGFEATLNRLSKWIVAAVFSVALLCRHDAESLWAVTGAVLNSILSHVLKRILNQERPVLTLRSDPGMPSSHAQSIFFILSFIILSFIEWLGMDAISMIISALALVIGSYLTWLRVSQQLHTFPQVAVGAAVGTIFAILWFLSWKAFVFKAFASYLWVRLVVIIVAAAVCLGFLVYMICHWLAD